MGYFFSQTSLQFSETYSNLSLFYVFILPGYPKSQQCKLGFCQVFLLKSQEVNRIIITLNVSVLDSTLLLDLCRKEWRISSEPCKTGIKENRPTSSIVITGNLTQLLNVLCSCIKLKSSYLLVCLQLSYRTASWIKC